MANGIILKSNTVSPIECLHYALNLPTSVVITGIDQLDVLDQALEAARTYASRSALDAYTETNRGRGPLSGNRHSSKVVKF